MCRGFIYRGVRRCRHQTFPIPPVHVRLTNLLWGWASASFPTPSACPRSTLTHYLGNVAQKPDMAQSEADPAEETFGHMPTLEPLLPPSSRDTDRPQPIRHRVPNSSHNLAEAASASSSSGSNPISRLIKSRSGSAASPVESSERCLLTQHLCLVQECAVPESLPC